MTVNYTTNLALGQPVTGTESGTWGDDVNNSVTSYLDIAIAGGLAVTITTTDVTLTLTQGTSSATNIGSTTAQYAILNVSGAMTAARNLILPSSSRQYVINNNTTGGFALTVKGSATSGVTMVNGEKAHVFWNGTDYAKMSNSSGGAGVFSSITNSGLTSGRVVYSTTGGLETDSANLTFDGTTLTANTIGAFTLSGTIAGGGNQINNVIIGTTTPLAGSFTSLSDSGNLTFTGTGNRITGDFSNATVASRVAFQTSTTNGNTIVNAIPNGTGVTSVFRAFNAADPTNAGQATIGITTSIMVVESAISGTGTYVPMVFYTSGSEKLRIAADTTGTYTFGGTAPRITGDMSNATVASRLMFQTSTVNGATDLIAIPNGTGTRAGLIAYNNSDTAAATANTQLLQLSTETRLVAGGSSPLPMTFYAGGVERLRLDTSGNVLVTNPAGLGYGTGSGGTVTQATSKSTGVTLNKPTGQITMNNAALAAGASVIFLLTNSLLAATDSVIVQPNYGANSQSYTAQVTFSGAGGAYIRVTNISGGSLSEAVTLSFAIIKGATS